MKEIKAYVHRTSKRSKPCIQEHVRANPPSGSRASLR